MKIKFHRSSVKLAGLYLAIIMAISLFFSVNVYQLSVQEFDKGFKVGPGIVTQLPGLRSADTTMTDFKNQLINERDRLYQEANHRVLMRLVGINTIIMVGGGFLSYYLARRTLQPIEEAHEAQSRFTADASHELRTPLTAMQSETEVALMNPKLTVARAKKQLQSNLEELGKLTALSEGLLRLAQLDNTNMSFRQPIAVAALLQQAVHQVVASAEAKNILIRSNVPQDFTIIAEESSLREAIIILLDNAIKYSPEKTEIHLTATQSSKHMTVQIQDAGIGIKATELPHIFERF